MSGSKRRAAQRLARDVRIRQLSQKQKGKQMPPQLPPQFVIPKRVNVQYVINQGPMAEVHHVTQQRTDGVEVTMTGGFTKLQASALQIAARSSCLAMNLAS